jgi:hypothetical protein
MSRNTTLQMKVRLIAVCMASLVSDGGQVTGDG